MSKQKQLNVRVDDAVVEALKKARIILRPSPSVSEIVRDAILEYVDRIEKAAARNKGHGR